VPPIAVAVRPAGSVSVTVTAPLVAANPELLAVIEYVAPVCPWVKLPVCDFEIVMSGNCVTLVTSLAESFVVMISPPPETATELVTLEAALFATLTVKVITG